MKKLILWFLLGGVGYAQTPTNPVTPSSVAVMVGTNGQQLAPSNIIFTNISWNGSNNTIGFIPYIGLGGHIYWSNAPTGGGGGGSGTVTSVSGPDFLDWATPTVAATATVNSTTAKFAALKSTNSLNLVYSTISSLLGTDTSKNAVSYSLGSTLSITGTTLNVIDVPTNSGNLAVYVRTNDARAITFRGPWQHASILASNKPIYQVIDDQSVGGDNQNGLIQTLDPSSSGAGWDFTRSGTNFNDPISGSAGPHSPIIDQRTGQPSVLASGQTNYIYDLEAAALIQVPCNAPYSDRPGYLLLVLDPGAVFTWAQASGSDANKSFMLNEINTSKVDWPLWQGTFPSDTNTLNPWDSQYLLAMQIENSTGKFFVRSNASFGATITTQGDINATFTPGGTACNINADGTIGIGNNDSVMRSSGNNTVVSHGGTDYVQWGHNTGFKILESGDSYLFNADNNGSFGSASARAAHVFTVDLTSVTGELNNTTVSNLLTVLNITNTGYLTTTSITNTGNYTGSTMSLSGLLSTVNQTNTGYIVTLNLTNTGAATFSGNGGSTINFVPTATDSSGHWTWQAAAGGGASNYGPLSAMTFMVSNFVTVTNVSQTNGVTIQPGSTNQILVIGNELGNTTSNGLFLSNPQVASTGNQIFSPAITFDGQGWKTTATAASQDCQWQMYLQPVQGAANPTSSLLFKSAINGAAFANTISFSSVGGITAINGDSILRSLTLDGNLSFSPTTDGITGTTAADNVVAGKVGEFPSSSVAVGSAVSLTTATPANITSISLTAGDWDVEANGNINYTLATVSGASGGISTTSATLPTDGSEANSGVQLTGVTTKDTITLPRKRVNVSGTTTVYLVIQSTFTGTSASGYGTINARRVR